MCGGCKEQKGGGEGVRGGEGGNIGKKKRDRKIGEREACGARTTSVVGGVKIYQIRGKIVVGISASKRGGWGGGDKNP